MVSEKVTVTNPQGMHMRPAQLFVNTVGAYRCDITILFGNREINARSIMNLMAACIKCGSEIEIQCDGEQEEEALKAAVDLVKSGLGE